MLTIKQLHTKAPQLFYKAQGLALKHQVQPTGHLDAARAAQGRQDIWVDACSTIGEPKPKTLILNLRYTNLCDADLIKKIQEMKVLGFNCYLPIGGKLRKLDELDEYAEDELKVDIIDDELQLINLATSQLELPADNVCILDDIKFQKDILERDTIQVPYEKLDLGYKSDINDSNPFKDILPIINNLSLKCEQDNVKLGIISTNYLSMEINRIDKLREIQLPKNASIKLQYNNIKIGFGIHEVHLGFYMQRGVNYDYSATIDDIADMFELELTSDVSMNDFLKFQKKFSSLKSLVLGGDNGYLRTILENSDTIQLPFLERLEINNKKISDKGDEIKGYVSDMVMIIQKCPNIKKLHIGHIDDFSEILDKITDEQIKKFRDLNVQFDKGNPNISKLFINGSNLKNLTLEGNFTLDELPQGCLDNLECLRIENSNISMHDLRRILLVAKNIREITLAGCSNLNDYTDQSPPVRLQNLEFLTIRSNYSVVFGGMKSIINANNFFDLLRGTEKNLKINISHCCIVGPVITRENHSKIKIREIISTIVEVDEKFISELFNSYAYIEKCDFSYGGIPGELIQISKNDSHESQIFFGKMKELSFNTHVKLKPEQYAELFKKLKNIESLAFPVDSIDSLPELIQFDRLKKLNIICKAIPKNKDFHALLAKCNNLTYFELRATEDCSVIRQYEPIGDLPEGCLDKLEHLKLGNLDLTADDVIKILSQIKKLSLLNINSCLTEEDIEKVNKYIKDNPDKFQIDNPSHLYIGGIKKYGSTRAGIGDPVPASPQSHTAPEVQEEHDARPKVGATRLGKVDLNNNNFKADVGEDAGKFSVQEIFKSYNAPNIPVNNYRLRVHDKLILGSERGDLFKLAHRDEKDYSFVRGGVIDRIILAKPTESLWPVDVNSSYHPLVNSNFYYAKCSLNLNENWHPLPSLSANETLTKLKLTGIDDEYLDMQYSVRDGLYYVKLKNPGQAKLVTLEYHLSVPKNHDLDIDSKIMPEYLINLIKYFRDFDSTKGKKLAGITPESTPKDVLDAIIAQKIGACRHRTTAFKYMVDSMKAKNELPENLEVRIVTNECHVFVEISLDGKIWYNCDLGGTAGVELDIAPVDTRPMQAPTSGTGKEQIPDLLPRIRRVIEQPDSRKYEQYEHLFATWQAREFFVGDAKSYAQELIANSSGKNKLVTVDSDANSNNICMLFRETANSIGRECYYIDNPDELVCSSSWLQLQENGSAKIIPGPGGALHQFLSKNMQTQPPPVIVVNYSNFSPQDLVRLNALVDKKRVADGTDVPSQAVVVGVYNNKKQGAYIGADFYSRFDRRYLDSPDLELPSEKIPDYSSKYTLPKIEPGAVNQDSKIIDLHGSPLWENIMLGTVKMQGDELIYADGELLKLIKSGFERGDIIIKNPPDIPGFTKFFEDLLLNRRINIHGIEFAIPDTIKFNTTSVYNFNLVADRINFIPLDFISPQYHVLNPSTLSSFLQGYTIDSRKLSIQPGILESAKEKAINILLTRDISESEWSLLLSKCKEYNVKINLKLASGVSLPESLGQKITGYQEVTEQAAAIDFSLEKLNNGSKYLVITSSDADVTSGMITQNNPNSHVIDVSELTSNDLLTRVSGGLTAGQKFEFSSQKAAIITSLEQGETIVLKGTYSPELIDQLMRFLHEDLDRITTNGKLIIVQDGKKDKVSIPSAQKFSHQVTLGEKRDLLQRLVSPTLIQRFDDAIPEQKQEVNLAKWVSVLKNCSSDKIDFNQPWQGLLTLPKSAYYVDEKMPQDAFNRTRLEQVYTVLKHSPFAFIAGCTGVGKSTFVYEFLARQPRVKVYSGEEIISDDRSKAKTFNDRLLDWANDKDPISLKVLFIDEANISSRNWSEFEGLFNIPPTIIINGEIHELTDNHRVIFAGNPLSYSDERSLPSLFARHGNTVLFKPMPKQFIKEVILLPCLDSIKDKTIKDSICKQILDIYSFACAKSENEVLVSARELEMIALLINAELIRNPNLDIQNTINKIAKLLVPEKISEEFSEKFPDKDSQSLQTKEQHTVNIGQKSQYCWTESREELKTTLERLISLKEFRRSAYALTDKQKYGGLGGLIIEGEPGVGKSDAVVSLLVDSGMEKNKDFYFIPVSMSVQEKINILDKAFHEGAIVIIDEINSTIMLEKYLNALLMGKTIDGKRPANPGFLLIGTQNPISMAGRQATSPALLRRTIKYNLPEFKQSEMVEVLTEKYKLDKVLAQDLVKAYQSQLDFARTNHKKPEPTFRDLIKAAESFVEAKDRSYRTDLGVTSSGTQKLPESRQQLSTLQSQLHDEIKSAESFVQLSDR